MLQMQGSALLTAVNRRRRCQFFWGGQISEQIQVIKKECKGIGIDISAYSSARGERREGERTLVCIKSAKVMSPFCI